MNIYIAAKYNHRFVLRNLVAMLQEIGIESTSQWINNAEESKSQQEAAQMDIDDIHRADAILFFAEPKGTANTGGGRYFELGYAYAINKKIYCVVVGEHETVFTSLSKVEVINAKPEEWQQTFEKVCAHLKEK